MSKVEMSSIRDGIYFQKLGGILSSLQQFEKSKTDFFSETYHTSINLVFSRLEKNNTELRNEMNEFIKLLNLQYAFLSRLKKEDKPVQISPVFKEFSEFTEEFGSIKDSLLDLNDFLGKFMGVTSYEFTELKRVYEEGEDLRYRYEQYKLKMTQGYNQKKELICSKKNVKKQFQISKILQLMTDISKEKEDSNQASAKLYHIATRQVNCKAKMYKDICDNLDYISGLYQRSFKEDILQKIKIYFKDKCEGMARERHELTSMKLDEAKTEEAFKSVQEEFYKLFDRFVTQITITRWPITYSEKSKQSEGKDQEERKMAMILTFDSKIILYQEQLKTISLEVSLEELKVSKPTAEGLIEVKNRKSKEKFNVRFATVDQEDEFYLHYQQIAQAN